MKQNNTYIAITGDVIHSRNTSESNFYILKEKLLEFNKKINPVVPFSIQAGDEIQGLLNFGNKPLSNIIWFLGELHPMKIRWGIGMGSLNSSIQQSSSNMRGSAFEYSRKALIYAKKNKQLFAYSSSKNDIEQNNIILKLISGIIDDWNIMAYRRCLLYFNTKTIYKVAESEGVSTEAINKHMNRTKIRLVLDSINYLDETVLGKSTL